LVTVDKTCFFSIVGVHCGASLLGELNVQSYTGMSCFCCHILMHFDVLIILAVRFSRQRFLNLCHKYVRLMLKVKCNNDYSVQNDKSLHRHHSNKRRVRKQDRKVRRDVI